MRCRLLALSINSRRCSTSVAFGAKQTLSHAYRARFMSTSSVWPRRRVARRPDFDPSGNLAAAPDRLRLPWRQSISQFPGARRRTLVRPPPTLHPGLDLIPWHAFAGALERGEAAGVFGQRLQSNAQRRAPAKDLCEYGAIAKSRTGAPDCRPGSTCASRHLAPIRRAGCIVESCRRDRGTTGVGNRCPRSTARALLR